MTLAFGLRWAIRSRLWLLLDWARRQLGQLVKKTFMVALTMVVISIIIIIITAVTMDCSSLSIREPAVLMGHQQTLSQRILRVFWDILLHFPTLLSFQEPLTIANLLRHRDQLQNLKEASYELSACLERAINEFSKEPPVVQVNARMSIQCAGQALQFLSGWGDCEISVHMLHQHIQYKVQERTAELYLARLALHPGPLSVDDLLIVQHRLQAWGVLTKELRGCLDFAIQEFSEELLHVQADARMVVDCTGQELSFIAGSGRNQINVYDDRDGHVHYHIRMSGVWALAARVLNGKWFQSAKSQELPRFKFAQLE